MKPRTILVPIPADVARDFTAPPRQDYGSARRREEAIAFVDAAVKDALDADQRRSAVRRAEDPSITWVCTEGHTVVTTEAALQGPRKPCRCPAGSQEPSAGQNLPADSAEPVAGPEGRQRSASPNMLAADMLATAAQLRRKLIMGERLDRTGQGDVFKTAGALKRILRGDP